MGRSIERAPSGWRPADSLAASCFLLSGFSGLVFEICWIRKAALVFGATTFAVSTILAVFFAGLAVGSFLFGGIAQRSRAPLRLYAKLEIAVGLLGLASPTLFDWAETLFGAVYPAIGDRFVLLSAVRLAVIAAIVLPPTILMGGTLPLFCRRYVRTEQRVSLSVGLLYGLNTLGAAAGSAVCGFWAIRHVGVDGSIYAAGAINLSIGLCIWFLVRDVLPAADGPPAARPDEPAPGGRRSLRVLYGLFFFSGFVFLANEILWTRFLSLIVHNTVHTYALTLTVVLSGIVIGSIATCWFFDRTPHRALLFGGVQVLSGISVLAVLMLPADWWSAWIDAKRLGQQLWIAASVLLVPAILSGASFPLAMRMAIEHPAVAAGHVGRMTAVNTLGGIVGSLATGFLVLPLAGLQASLRLTTGVGVALGIAAWLLLEREGMNRRRWALAALSVAVWIGLPAVTGVRLPEDYLGRHGELVDFREGLNANLAVIRKDDTLQLEIDRLWQGERDKGHQIMAAHVPMLLHPGPSEVLVIGLGTGQAASRFLMHDVERLRGVDIEGALIPLIREHFESGWMDDERVTLIVEDGRNYLTHTDVVYDVISIEVGQVFRPAAAPLYAREFYESARRHLRPDGIVCQFVSTSLFSYDEFRTVVRTFIDVFPSSVLWYNTTELLLIGTVADGLRLGDEALGRITNDAELARDLQLSHWGGPDYSLNIPHVLAAGFLAGPASLDELSRGARIYRDDVPWLEYDTALPRPPEESRIIRLIADHLDPVASILAAPSPQWTSSAESVRLKNLRNMEARAASRPFESLWGAGRHTEALALLSRALQVNPENLDLRRTLAKSLSTTGLFAEAIPHYEAAVSAEPTESGLRNRLAECYLRTGRLDRAIRQLAESMRLDPRQPITATNLGLALGGVGRHREAVEALEWALELAPEDARVRLALEQAREQLR